MWPRLATRTGDIIAAATAAATANPAKPYSKRPDAMIAAASIGPATRVTFCTAACIEIALGTSSGVTLLTTSAPADGPMNENVLPRVNARR